MTTHCFECRVYYEDTDMAGIVYYANYLKYIERARSEQVRELGIDQHAMKNDLGIVFAVHRIEADYRSAARLDDLLRVETTLRSISGVRITYGQDVYCGDELKFSSRVLVVCMTPEGRAVRIPAGIRQKYAETLG
ncbi:MAG: tol-pal system-associated acyl-CoA thioesterase [Paracoccaceae bacterium]